MPDSGGDKGTAHTYIDVYENILKPYRENGNLLEIGIYHGHSLKMWGEYFINGKITGVDVEIHPKVLELKSNPKFEIIHHDATKQSVLDFLKNSKFDVIIDDGSHNIEDQITSFKILSPLVNSGGLYIIEDILNIDKDREKFYSLNESCSIIDNRRIKGRWDDILVVYKF